ncbi:hypothetical protein FACS189429_0900 [Bacteroidia bacterium]|nr:hypothetical protein FACS189429_0900 [Bacteroidia bacterium]
MKKWITLLVILLTFSSVNGQNLPSEFRFGNRDVENSTPVSVTIPRTREEVVAMSGKLQLSSAPALRSTTEVRTLLSEGFNACALGDIPAGWTRTVTPVSNRTWGASQWNNHDAPDNTTGTFKSMRIMSDDYIPQDAWLFTPALSLEGGKSYTVTYWLQFAGWKVEGGAESFERLDVKIGKGATASDMTVLLDHQEVALNRFPPYLKIVLTYTAPETADFYLGFHSFSDAYAIFTAFDDLLVEEAPENNLVVLPDYPHSPVYVSNYGSAYYSQVPLSQNTFRAKATNEGALTQTNVVLNATINSTQAGTSAPVASLDAKDTVGLTIPDLPLVIGQNDVSLTVSSDQIDDRPSDNTLSFSVTGTKNIYAVDELITPSTKSWGRNDGTITMGHIYEIVDSVTLNGAELAFRIPVPLDYAISLYRMAGDLTIDPTPIFTVPAVRNSTILHIEPLPETLLEPGRYYLGANQLGGNGVPDNLNLTTDIDDNGMGRKIHYIIYTPEQAAGQEEMYYNTGSVMLRMVLKTDEPCVVPANLQVVSDSYSSSTFSWDGDAALYEITLNILGTSVSQTFTTPLKTVTITGLPTNSMFSWTVKAICDGVSSSVAVGGPGFNTLICEVVSIFPFTEGFEDGLTAIPCWTKISNNEENGEAGETPFGVFKGADFEPLLEPYSGDYVWRFSSYTEHNSWDPNPYHELDYNQYLITPELAATEDDKTFSFFYKNYGHLYDTEEKFRVGYSTTDTNIESFTWGQEIVSGQQEPWAEYLGSFPGNAKYIAVNYYAHALYYLYIDDITIDLAKENAVADINAAPAVYPTLTKGRVTVNTVSDAKVKVTDIAGRVLAAYQSTGQLPIDLNYTNGVYFISVENGKAVTTHKVVLQR